MAKYTANITCTLNLDSWNINDNSFENSNIQNEIIKKAIDELSKIKDLKVNSIEIKSN